MLATKTRNSNQVELCDDDRDGTYLPTPEEIRACCQEIQAEWTEAERMRRSRGQAGRPRTVSVTPRRYARILIDFVDTETWAG